MLEITFTTFYVSNVLLHQQYWERRFTKYSELISCFLIAKQNNELLMRNHQSRLIGSEPFPEVNVISSQTCGCGWEWGHGRGRGRNPRYHGSYSNNHQILIKGKPHCTTKSRIILRQNKKMGSVYKINLLRTMRIIVIDVVWKGIGRVPVVRPNIWSTFTKHQ